MFAGHAALQPLATPPRGTWEEETDCAQSRKRFICVTALCSPPIAPPAAIEVQKIVVRVSYLNRKSERTKIQFPDTCEQINFPLFGSFETDILPKVHAKFDLLNENASSPHT